MDVDAASASAFVPGVHTVVLVEGHSDRRAVEAMARRLGRDLADEGTAIVAMGGATNIQHFVDRLGPSGLGLRLTGLCDVGEVDDFTRALTRAGLGTNLDRTAFEALGFFVCDADLEDELIRALGTDSVEQLVETEGDLRSLRTFLKQPAQQGRARSAQLRRFMGTRSGRKIHYAAQLVDALDVASAPRPLFGLLDHLSRAPSVRAARRSTSTC